MIYEELLTAMNHNVLGIFWISKEQLVLGHPLIPTMDYLTNGQISKLFIRTNLKPNFAQKNIFIQKNFDQKSFVCHVTHDESKVKQNIEEIASIVTNQKSERKTLLLINETSYDYRTAIVKAFGDLPIEEFKLQEQ